MPMRSPAAWQPVKGTSGDRCLPGVEAQTLANIYLALEHDLEIIPVINKIDLPSANPDWVKEQLMDIGIDVEGAILASAKDGTGIEDILDAIIKYIPAPENTIDSPPGPGF